MNYFKQVHLNEVRTILTHYYLKEFMWRNDHLTDDSAATGLVINELMAKVNVTTGIKISLQWPYSQVAVSKVVKMVERYLQYVDIDAELLGSHLGELMTGRLRGCCDTSEWELGDLFKHGLSKPTAELTTAIELVNAYHSDVNDLLARVNLVWRYYTILIHENGIVSHTPKDRFEVFCCRLKQVCSEESLIVLGVAGDLRLWLCRDPERHTYRDLRRIGVTESYPLTLGDCSFLQLRQIASEIDVFREMPLPLQQSVLAGETSWLKAKHGTYLYNVYYDAKLDEVYTPPKPVSWFKRLLKGKL